MYIKRIKRKCCVRGCKNTETFAISKSKEMGNSIIVCEKCLKQAIEAIESLPSPSNTGTKKESEAPQLFFNPAFAFQKAREAEKDSEALKCEYCGKDFESSKGLKAHIRSCKERSKEE